MAELLKEAELIDAKEDAKYKTDKEQELLRKKLSNNEYLKEKIGAAIEQLKVEDKKKINLTDGDANHMKAGGSKDIRPSYNCQTAVTEEGVIIAAEAVTQANDHNQLQPMVEQSESNSNEKVEESTADAGYGSYENYEFLEDKGIDGYVPDLQFHQYKKASSRKTVTITVTLNSMKQRTVISAPKERVCPTGKQEHTRAKSASGITMCIKARPAGIAKPAHYAQSQKCGSC